MEEEEEEKVIELGNLNISFSLNTLQFNKIFLKILSFQFNKNTTIYNEIFGEFYLKAYQNFMKLLNNHYRRRLGRS